MTAKPVAALPEAELLPNPDAVFLIFFDDQDCRPQIIVGEAAARHRFKEISGSWNAHLFGKIESNSRDDKYHTNNVALLAAQAPADRALMQQALEALESCEEGDYSTGTVCHPSFDENAVYAAIASLRTRIAGEGQ